MKRLIDKWRRLARERQTRWASDAHHCTVCGAAFGPNQECRC